MLRLNTPPRKLFGVRRLQLWATGDVSADVQSFLAKHQITQVTQPPYSPDLVPYDFWLLPELKSPLKGKRFQIVHEIEEDMMGLLMAIPAKDFAVF